MMYSHHKHILPFQNYQTEAAIAKTRCADQPLYLLATRVENDQEEQSLNSNFIHQLEANKTEHF